MFRKYTLEQLARVSAVAAKNGLHFAMFTFKDAVGANSCRVAYFEEYWEMKLWCDSVKSVAYDAWELACFYRDGVLVDVKGI